MHSRDMTDKQRMETEGEDALTSRLEYLLEQGWEPVDEELA